MTKNSWICFLWLLSSPWTASVGHAQSTSEAEDLLKRISDLKPICKEDSPTLRQSYVELIAKYHDLYGETLKSYVALSSDKRIAAGVTGGILTAGGALWLFHKSRQTKNIVAAGVDATSLETLLGQSIEKYLTVPNLDRYAFDGMFMKAAEDAPGYGHVGPWRQIRFSHVFEPGKPARQFLITAYLEPGERGFWKLSNQRGYNLIHVYEGSVSSSGIRAWSSLPLERPYPTVTDAVRAILKRESLSESSRALLVDKLHRFHAFADRLPTAKNGLWAFLKTNGVKLALNHETKLVLARGIGKTLLIAGGIGLLGYAAGLYGVPEVETTLSGMTGFCKTSAQAGCAMRYFGTLNLQKLKCKTLARLAEAAESALTAQVELESAH